MAHRRRYLVHALLGGADMPLAVDTGRALAAKAPKGDEIADAIGMAVALAESGVPSSEDLESLGGGWVGEEALAIAVACALSAEEIGVEAALTLAVTHSGDSDSTGSICGNLLGAIYGAVGLPATWVNNVEGGDTIRRLAADCATARLTFRLERSAQPARTSRPGRSSGTTRAGTSPSTAQHGELEAEH